MHRGRGDHELHVFHIRIAWIDEGFYKNRFGVLFFGSGDGVYYTITSRKNPPVLFANLSPVYIVKDFPHYSRGSIEIGDSLECLLPFLSVFYFQ